MWAVVQRELRVEARRPTQYWLRAGVAAGFVGVCTWAALDLDVRGTGHGLFQILSKFGLAGLVLLAPLLTADCLAREKREGTLGLLFLTPLRPRDVVWGKSFLQCWRALILMAATWPALTVPILMGGIGFADILRMLFLQTGALGLALAAGVAASALTSRIWRARLLAVCFTVLASVVFVCLHVFLLTAWQWVSARQAGIPMDFPQAFARRLAVWIQWQWFGLSNGFAAVPAAGYTNWQSVGQAGALAAGSGLLVWCTGRAAARGLERTWRRDARALEPGRMHRLLTDPLGKASWARGSRKFWLERAPLVWLQRRRWSARLATWLTLGLAGVLFVGIWVEHPQFNVTLRWSGPCLAALLMGMGAAAAGRFQGEEGRAEWELLSVCPMSRRSLVAGLAASVLATFAPALLVVAGAHVLAAIESSRASNDLTVRYGLSWGSLGNHASDPLWMVLNLTVGGAAMLACGMESAIRGRVFLTGTLLTYMKVGIVGFLVVRLISEPVAWWMLSRDQIRIVYWMALTGWTWRSMLRRVNQGE